MNQEKILKFTQNSIYDTVDELGKWNGYDVWKPGFSDDQPRCIGFPQFILVKDDSIRWTEDWEESRKIMRKFYPSNDED